MAKYSTIDHYIKSAPKEARLSLSAMRDTIKKAAPLSQEKIGYGIPTFTYYGNLVHFAGFKNHIGFYPTPGAIVAFKKELSRYEQAKGSVRFPIDKPLPLSLITKIVKFRVRENEMRSKNK